MTKAHIFDAYGTLFDVHSAVRAYAPTIGPQADDLSALWRTKQLEYSWVYGLMGAQQDFWNLTQNALDFAMQSYQLSNPELRAQLLAAYWELKPYPEVTAFLKSLKNDDFKTGILSNGSPDMLDAAVQSAGLDTLLDACLSVNDAQTFKTDARTYRLVTRYFGVKPEDVTFYSSNRWDIAGATKFGFRTIWVNRTGMLDEYLDFVPDQIVTSLTRQLI